MPGILLNGLPNMFKTSQDLDIAIIVILKGLREDVKCLQV